MRTRISLVYRSWFENVRSVGVLTQKGLSVFLETSLVLGTTLAYSRWNLEYFVCL